MAMTYRTPVVLPMLLASSLATVYTASLKGRSSTSAADEAVALSITKATLCNTDSSARTANVYIRPDNSSATAKDAVRLAIPLAASGTAGDTYTLPEMVGRSLQTGWTIQAYASVASKVSFVVEAALVT